MNITILNGDMSKGESDFTEYLEKLKNKFQEENDCSIFHLNEMNLRYCNGCWSCWWKTPGLCSKKDNAGEIFESVIQSDFFIFASPLMAGFTSSALKKITDRLIVLLHPYLILKNGEAHHQKRYKKYPNFGLILEKEVDTDNEDTEIIKDIYDRLAVNFHAKNKFIKFIDQDKVEDVFNEICNI